MQVGDLVRLRKPMSGYGNVLDGEYLIFLGNGLWDGWGRFTDTKGQAGQIRFVDVEVI